MEVTIRADRQGDHGYVVPSGAFDLLHATAVARSLDTVRSQFETCRSVELDLAHIDHIDGTGAALLARLLDRLDASGCRTHVVEDHNPEATRLIALYRGRGANRPAQLRRTNLLERIGLPAAEMPGKVTLAFDFIGRSAIALPKAIVPRGRSIGDRCRGCSRRLARTRSSSRPQPTCWWASSSGFSVSRSSSASVPSYTCPSLSLSHNSAS